MSNWIGDFRIAARALGKRPLFVLVAAGSLAIGIGANTAVFSAVSALLLRPMPGMENHDRVVEIGRSYREEALSVFSYPDFLDMRASVSALEEAAAFAIRPMNVAASEGGVRAMGLMVSPEYFQLLGVGQGQGRYFTADEGEGIGEHPVAVLTHDFWMDRLGGDPQVVGSTVMVNRNPYTVVGVTPPEFRGHMMGYAAELFVPIVQQGELDGVEMLRNREASGHLALGSLAPGATLGQLNQLFRAYALGMEEVRPEETPSGAFRASAMGAVSANLRPRIRLFLGSLLAMVGLVLLVTCTNVAGMFVARSLAREREVAVRRALGAGRGRLATLLTAETLLVFLLGGGVGAWLGSTAVQVIRADHLPIQRLTHVDLSADAGVLVVVLGVTLVTGLLFGLLPAAQATRLDVVSSLKGEDGAGGGRASGLRRVFAGAQVGLSLVVLVAAGLFVRSVQKASAIDPGLDPAGVYVVGVDLNREGYDGDEGRFFQEQVIERLAAQGWVETAALSLDLPLDMSRRANAVFPEGWSADPEARPLQVGLNAVTPDYFETLRIPVLSGRTFEDTDDPDSEPVVVVTEAFVEAAFPGQDALGRTVRGYGQEGRTYRIVGVVGDTKNSLITDPEEPFIYFPMAQDYDPTVQISVRADLPPEVAVPRRSSLTWTRG